MHTQGCAALRFAHTMHSTPGGAVTLFTKPVAPIHPQALPDTNGFITGESVQSDPSTSQAAIRFWDMAGECRALPVSPCAAEEGVAECRKVLMTEAGAAMAAPTVGRGG